MALYMFQGTYTPQAWVAMTHNPQDRSVGLAELVQKLGGKLVNLYYCFGEYDVVAIFEAPDDTTATAMVLAAISPGHAHDMRNEFTETLQPVFRCACWSNKNEYRFRGKGRR